ncbi:MAG: pyocin activator PrtN family protein [Acinetobacter haemolyticus]
METGKINLSDYLFMQFKTLTPTLDQICATYYPHLKKEQLLEKARKKEFPFPCYRIDESQKSPYFVNIFEFSEFLIQALKINQRYIATEVQHSCRNNS